ncbi:hypothetical protein [Mangrovivirga cuniculi]|uniref:Uncharacterized protein n=1 Tax=Mangrovivirga cuniculi TaxID=2715131 RepID=A0A4D7JIZ3_9BACT|nr:hypothetical protein [Mangrovivirga cuniculi]QCK15949.1 hypothetical protein DCC35_14975 [Mangrovivirga cuniculi]
MIKKIFGIVLMGIISFCGLKAQDSANGQATPDGGNEASNSEIKKSKEKEVENINYFEAAKAAYEKKQVIIKKIKNGEIVADEAKTSRGKNND